MSEEQAQYGKSKLDAFASPLVAKNHFIKASFGGFAGSGKSRTGSELLVGAYKEMNCTKPVLFIDNEKGSRFLIPFFKTHGIKTLVKDTMQVADVLQAFEFLQKGEIDFLFIDSLTKVYVKYVRDYKAKNHIVFMTLGDWGKVLPAWQEEFSDRFVDVNGNVIFTGRGGFSYEKEEDVTDEETGKVRKGQFVKSGVKMKMAGETPFEPDINVWMDIRQTVGAKNKTVVWREAQVMKDRSGLIDGKTFKNPTYKDFQPVVKFLMGNPTGEVAGATNTDNTAPSENWDGYRKKEAREIELEKIKAVFDKLGLGTSAKEKQVKVLATEKVFGTTSGTEIEKMSAETLAFGRHQLERLFANWDQIEPEERLQHVVDFRADETAEQMFPFDKATGGESGTGVITDAAAAMAGPGLVANPDRGKGKKDKKAAAGV